MTNPCIGADDPEERCPRHPKDCTCWQVDLNQMEAATNMSTAEPVSVTVKEEIYEAAWVAFRDSNKPVIYNQVKDAVNAALSALSHVQAPTEEDALGYATRLVTIMAEKHYPDGSPDWKPLPDVVGILTQIDNMVSGMVRAPQIDEAMVERMIHLTPAEIQSGYDRIKWAEGLILQLPDTHDGRNSWLLNYGISEEADAIRKNNHNKKPLGYEARK